MAKNRKAPPEVADEAADQDPLEARDGSASFVPIEDITIDPALQMRDAPHTADYVEQLAGAIRAGTLHAPVILFRNPKTGKLLLADGHARHEAHHLAGAGDVLADVREGDRRDAFRHALGANATHGARRTNRDLRKAVMAALTDGETAKLSNPAIATLCACSDTFVGNLRKETGGSNGANPAQRVGKDGRLQASTKRSRTGVTPSAAPPLGPEDEAPAVSEPTAPAASSVIERADGDGPVEATVSISAPDTISTSTAPEPTAPEPTVTDPDPPSTDLRALVQRAVSACEQLRRALDGMMSPDADQLTTHGPDLRTEWGSLLALRTDLDVVLAHLGVAPPDHGALDQTTSGSP